MGLVDEVVGLSRVVFVLNQARSVCEKVEDWARTRKGLAGRQERASVENKVEAAAPFLKDMKPEFVQRLSESCELE